MFLQATELTAETAHAAANVTAHANAEPLTALLWLLVLLFGGALALLLYKLIWKDKPVGQLELDALREQLTELKTAFAERKQSADSLRLQDKLNYDKDFATITEILKEGAETTKQTVGILANVGHLKEGQNRQEQEIREVHKKVDNMNDHIIRLAQNHAASRNP